MTTQIPQSQHDSAVSTGLYSPCASRGSTSFPAYQQDGLRLLIPLRRIGTLVFSPSITAAKMYKHPIPIVGLDKLEIPEGKTKYMLAESFTLQNVHLHLCPRKSNDYKYWRITLDGVCYPDANDLKDKQYLGYFPVRAGVYKQGLSAWQIDETNRREPITNFPVTVPDAIKPIETECGQGAERTHAYMSATNLVDVLPREKCTIKVKKILCQRNWAKGQERKFLFCLFGQFFNEDNALLGGDQ